MSKVCTKINERCERLIALHKGPLKQGQDNSYTLIIGELILPPPLNTYYAFISLVGV